ncbi:MAG TPA: ATP synthase F1 subunit gamma [Gemmatimonas aurantiaca]|uniref:ATP synthase gamma chain n=2 Tax=Gemmatimonas aurantiaca TaxID=173480 RepID=ATPG_GEMAT|nr:ATP synthase F1 subunit gamma [Gemmatimonas aurantiaca]C1A697.1 RecName: Full=ATP synthase gamma chain; AltName: Full=ATP synthase F1 sector gamma subunit; AltName: Full=F-ATPase gamma subunit [Gemmatimonas aurantiaca T-27]BAH37757.1 ATP synthase gamma chain [Gemmatimonas aurantiaca T-27]HCT58790.1 ATP synthase F1 subunit gamma [Gemmatimonas aurantiaca]
MAKGKELKGRIRSTENTRKITRTMEMVATSKLKRATDRVAAARPYALALGEVLSHVYSPELADRFPLLRRPAAPRTVALVILTANRGLCGAFNANLIKEARSRIAELEAKGLTVELHVVGRKGVGFFRYVNRAIASQRTDITDKPSAADAASLIDGLMQRFAAGSIDAVYITYAKYLSALSAPPATEQVLPVAPPTAKAEGGVQHDFILAPSADAILEALLPLYVRNAVYRALVETEAGFQSAQRTAMKNATDNATELLQVLKRTYNSARQAQITQEIAEIVGGASALQG